MSSYKASIGYQAYLNSGTRPDKIPPYEFIDGQVIIYPGEIYCRYRLHGETICLNSQPASSINNLRHHIKRHGLNIYQPKSGAPSLDRQLKAMNWYSQFIKKDEIEQSEEQVAEEVCI